MRHDAKVNALRIKYPGWGYTVWCMLLETFADSRDRSVEWNELNQELIAADFLIDQELLVEIVDYAVKINLLQIKDGFLMSFRFRERFENLDEKREQKSSAGKLGAAARWGENRNRMAQNGETMAPSKQSVTSKSKDREEKSKEKDSSSCCSSSLESAQPRRSAEEEKQQQDFVFIFFLKNWAAPKAEFFNKFLPWNNSGGRSWKDMDYEQRFAALVQWNQKPQMPARFTKTFLGMWEQMVGLMMDKNAPPDVIWAALDDGLKWEQIRDGEYRLHCKSILQTFLDKNIRHFVPIIHDYFGQISLFYNITDST